MRITGLETWVHRTALSVPYAIANESFDHAENVFLRIVTDTGPTGLGCSAPDFGVTRETAATVVESIDAIVRDAIVGLDPRRMHQVLGRISEPLRLQPAALAAVDMALHDLLGKTTGLPVWLLLGGFRDRIDTSITIGILPLDETVDCARRHAANGFRALKLKGGMDVDEDIEKIHRVREAVGPAVELRFDANQGYDVATALRFVESTRSAKLELIEQPTPSDSPDSLARVSLDSSLPVMADESLLTLRDAFRIASQDLADMVNIKLMKVGGIVRARRIYDVARAARLEVMVGCMDECALAIAAGLHFSLAYEHVEYADLDGHLDLVDDPTAGAVILERGCLRPLDRPGFGIEL